MGQENTVGFIEPTIEKCLSRRGKPLADIRFTRLAVGFHLLGDLAGELMCLQLLNQIANLVPVPGDGISMGGERVIVHLDEWIGAVVLE